MYKSKPLLALLVAAIASGASALTMVPAAQAELGLEAPIVLGSSNYTGTTGAFTWEVIEGTRVTCAASGSTSEGHLELRTMTALLHLRGCKPPEVPSWTCKTEGAAAGEIVTQPLKGHLYYVKRSEHVAGYVFKPVTGENVVTNVTCGTVEQGNIRGSVIGLLTPSDYGGQAKFTLQFKQKKGHQEPAQYEEEGTSNLLSTSFETNWPYPKHPFVSNGWAFEETANLSSGWVIFEF